MFMVAHKDENIDFYRYWDIEKNINKYFDKKYRLTEIN